jgi:hypothetical protein
MDWVHDAGARVHKTSLNEGRPSGDLRLGLNEPKGYLGLLISVVDARTDGLQWLSKHRWCDRGGAPGPRQWLAGVGRYRHSGPPFLMRSWPKGAARGGDSSRGVCWSAAVTWAVHAMGCPSSSSSVTVRVSSGGAPAHPRPQAISPWSPQAPPRFQLWQAAVNRSSSKFLLGARAWFLWMKIQGK